MSTYRRILLATLAVALLALSAGTASQAYAARGGSIVFAKGGKIFVVGPDGRGMRAVTRAGSRRNPFEHPTQANNGTIAALRGPFLYRFSRRGRPLGKRHEVAAGVTKPGPLRELAQAAEISPDGRRVVFFKYLLQGIEDPSGSPGTNVLAVTIVWVAASSGRRQGEIHTPGDHYENPSWIDNSHLLFFAPYNLFVSQVFTWTLGGGGNSWFADEFNGEDFLTRQPLDDGELSAARDKLALVKGTNVQGDSGNAVIQLYAVSSLGQLPTPACSFRPPGSGPFSGPSWSPDGSSIAWSDTRGVWTSRVNLAAGNCGVAPKLVARGGQAPDWGRAAVGRK